MFWKTLSRAEMVLLMDCERLKTRGDGSDGGRAAYEMSSRSGSGFDWPVSSRAAARGVALTSTSRCGRRSSGASSRSDIDLNRLLVCVAGGSVTGPLDWDLMEYQREGSVPTQWLRSQAGIGPPICFSSPRTTERGTPTDL